MLISLASKLQEAATELRYCLLDISDRNSNEYLYYCMD